METIYQKVAELQQKGKDGVLVTVVDAEGESPAYTGNKMLVQASGETTGTVGGGTLEYLAVKKAKQVLATRKNVLEYYNLSDKDEGGQQTGMACGGRVALFYEALIQQQSVYIFGAGHIGRALYHFLQPLDLQVTIVDDRTEMLHALENDNKAIHADFKEFMQETRFPEKPFFLLATYQHHHDSTILNEIFKQRIETPYIGIVASHKTLDHLLQRLYNEMGYKPGLSNIYAPVGLDIGSKDAPAEIALSIAAEVQAVRHGKQANHLRDKKPKK